MVKYLRPTKEKSFLSCAQIIATLSLVLFPACSNLPLTPADPNILSKEEIFRNTLTDTGSNRRPVLDMTQSTVYFVSEKRNSHQNPQAYSISLITKNERRLVYHDGELFEVQPSNERYRYFYSSNTDELKERPPLFYKPVSPYPMSEIYSYEGGLDFKRHTTHPGFDGSLRWWENQGLLFVSHQNRNFNLNLVDLSQTIKVQLTSKNYISVVGVSANKVRAWIESQDSNQTLHLGAGSWQKSEKFQIPFELENPRWAGVTDFIIGSVKDEPRKKHRLIAIDTERKCWGPFLEAEVDIIDPFYDSEHERIYYAAGDTNQFEISFLPRKMQLQTCISLTEPDPSATSSNGTRPTTPASANP